MGCWSESCAVSGLEIPHNAKIYVALVAESRYGNDLELTVPPIAGTYDDYGGLDLTETFTSLGLKEGENWEVREDKRGAPVYIDAEVFDYLLNIEKEFAYKGPKTIGGSLDELVTTLREKIEAMRGLERYSDPEWFKIHSELDRYLGHNSTAMEGAREKLDRILYKKDDGRTEEEVNAQIEEFILLFRRSYVFNVAQRELRKRFVPKVKGPQHGGGEALLGFYREVYRIIRARKEAENADLWNMEVLDKEFDLNLWMAAVSSEATQLGFREWQIEKANER